MEYSGRGSEVVGGDVRSAIILCEFVAEEINGGSDDGREGSDIDSVQDVGNDSIRE